RSAGHRMVRATVPLQGGGKQQSAMQRVGRRLWKERYVYLLLLPGILYFLVYRYLPMGGLVIAFKDFNPFAGLWASEWVGMAHFLRIFEDDEVVKVLWNTIVISLLQILVAFPVSIVLALMLNEVRNEAYKRFVQSM